MKIPAGRLPVLVLVFGIWIFLCAALLVRSTVFRRDELRKKSEKISWRTGVIPVLRGRILDRSGLPLAWTEAEKDAVLEALPKNRHVREALLREIGETFPSNPAENAKTVPRILIRNLTPGQMEKWADLVRRYPAFVSVRTRILRKRVEYLSVRNTVGECAVDDKGVQTGVSGLEKEHDTVLAGRPGRFRVMLDRNGRWMADSLRIEDAGEPGKDVTLKTSLREMTGETAGRHDE